MSLEKIPHVEEAFRRILKPLATVLLRERISYVDFLQLMQSAYIETAIRDGLGDNLPRTIPRIAIATGINQNVIKDYVFNRRDTANREPVLTSVLAEIMHQWNTNPAYVGPYGGVARELDFDRTPGSNFVELALSTGTTISPNVLLAELLAANVVKQGIDSDGNTRYRIAARTFVHQNSARLSAGSASHFANAMTNLASTLAHNFQPRVERRRLERTVYTAAPLSLEQMEELEDYIRAEVAKLMDAVDDYTTELAKSTGAEQPEEPIEFGLSIFQYLKHPDDKSPLSELIGKGDQ